MVFNYHREVHRIFSRSLPFRNFHVPPVPPPWECDGDISPAPMGAPPLGTTRRQVIVAEREGWQIILLATDEFG